MFKFIVSFLITLHTSISFAALSPVEKEMQHYFLMQNTSQITLLKKLVNINSGTSNIQGVYKVGKIVEYQLKLLGFKTYWVNEPAAMHKAGTLIAERHGKQGNKILLIGHLDTVFPESSKFKYFQLKKGNATGPGIIDDKGGLVVMLYALKALHSVHALDNTTITVVLTGDEEDSGKPTIISRKPLISVAKKADVALDFEPSISLETASISRRGISNWQISISGNESHSATIFLPDVGDGAIFEMARILNTLQAQLKGEKYLSFNPGIAMGGTQIIFNKATSKASVFGKENVVAKTAFVRGDFRFLDEKQKKWFEDKLTKIVSACLPGTHSAIEFEKGIPAMQPTNNNLTLLKKYSQVSEDLNQGVIKPLNAGIRGAGDISYVAAIVPANLAGLGPLGLGTHSINESIELKTLPIQTERAAILIYRLTRP